MIEFSFKKQVGISWRKEGILGLREHSPYKSQETWDTFTDVGNYKKETEVIDYEGRFVSDYHLWTLFESRAKI